MFETGTNELSRDEYMAMLADGTAVRHFGDGRRQPEESTDSDRRAGRGQPGDGRGRAGCGRVPRGRGKSVLKAFDGHGLRRCELPVHPHGPTRHGVVPFGAAGGPAAEQSSTIEE